MIRHLLIGSAILCAGTGVSQAQDAAAGEKVFAKAKSAITWVRTRKTPWARFSTA